MAGTYRVGIIGRTGRGDYGHGLADAWKDVEQGKVIAVADEDEKGRAAAAERYGAKRSYADYRQMLEKEDLDIVTVCPRWIDCHRDMAVAAAEHGCHVYLEKPLCRTLEEADEIVDAFERHKVKLVMSVQTRYSPRMERVRELIGGGKLGDVVELRGRGKEDHRGGGEDLMVLGIHIMDMMRYVSGDPRWCYARVRQDGKPITKKDVREGNEGIGPLAGDEVIAMYGFDSPTTGYFGSHKAKDGAWSRFGLNIYGTKGMITLTHGSLPEAHFIADPGWAPGRSDAKWVEISSAGLGKPEPMKDKTHHPSNVRTCKDLIRAIETDTQPNSSMYEARKALEMIMAVYESERIDGPAAIPLKTRKHPLTLL